MLPSKNNTVPASLEFILGNPSLSPLESISCFTPPSTYFFPQGFPDDLADPGHVDPPLNAWCTNLEVLAPRRRRFTRRFMGKSRRLMIPGRGHDRKKEVIQKYIYIYT